MAFERFAELVSHVYWHRKAEFMLDSDIYESWTIFAVEEGKFRYRIGDQTGVAGAGELVVCPPGVGFGREVIEPLSFHFFHFNWSEAFEQHEAGMSDFIRGCKVEVEDTHRLWSTFRLLSRKVPGPIGFAATQHLLNDLLLQLAVEREERRYAPAQDRTDDPVMQHAMIRMRDLAYSPFSMRALAEELELTPVQLTRRFRSFCGQTPQHFVTELRLRRATHLLTETSLSLEHIAQQCGYENGFYLSRIFQKKKGISPSQYRKLNKL